MLEQRTLPTRVLLVRHGQGWAKVEHVIAGQRSCTGLTPTGCIQVEALGAYWASQQLTAEALLSSPVRRARESAEILACRWHGLTVVEDCSLCELHLGNADGLTWVEYEAAYQHPFDLLAEPERAFAPGAQS